MVIGDWAQSPIPIENYLLLIFKFKKNILFNYYFIFFMILINKILFN